MVIIINNATFAKSAYVGKIMYGVWPFSQTSGLSAGMVGLGGVVVRIVGSSGQFDSAYPILDPPVLQPTTHATIAQLSPYNKFDDAR